MLIGGFLGGIVAQNKGRNIFFWTLLCGIMPLTLLILLALPKLAQLGISRPCPFCLRIIPWDASVCAYCQERVPRPQTCPCAFCGNTIWTGQSHCSSCGKPTDNTQPPHKQISKQ